MKSYNTIHSNNITNMNELLLEEEFNSFNSLYLSSSLDFTVLHILKEKFILYSKKTINFHQFLLIYFERFKNKVIFIDQIIPIINSYGFNLSVFDIDKLKDNNPQWKSFIDYTLVIDYILSKYN